MRLTLSSRSPWNTEYLTTEKGVVYNVYSPLTHGTRIIAICRPTPSTGSSTEAEIVAEIEWHSFRTSKIRIMGQEWPVDTFFRRKKKGLGLLIGRCASTILLDLVLTWTIDIEIAFSLHLMGRIMCGRWVCRAARFDCLVYILIFPNRPLRAAAREGRKRPGRSHYCAIQASHSGLSLLREAEVVPGHSAGRGTYSGLHCSHFHLH